VSVRTTRWWTSIPPRSQACVYNSPVIDLDDDTPRSAPAAMAALKRWVREALALGDDDTVMVTELTCREPGCPPLETVVAVLRGPGRTWQFKVHTPVAALTDADRARLLAAWHEHVW